jgi:diguanylate cyclase
MLPNCMSSPFPEDETVPEEMDLDYANNTAARAIELMTCHGIPQTADNFGVWFQYVLATDAAFNRTIDVIITNKTKFDKRINWGLVKTLRALQGRAAPISSIVTDRLSEVLGKATSYLAKAAADNRAHVAKLGDVAAQAESGCDPLILIGELANELSRAALRATCLETQFTSTSKELDRLRTSLRVAQHCANTDPLTGLANRRSLDDFMRAALIKAMEHDEALSVMLIDIDHFKKFNDSFGHQLGDQVLRLIAGVLKNDLRQADLAARYGGEELIAVLPGTDLSACREVAERIRLTIAERQIVRRTTGEALGKVTVSIGVAQFVLGETVAELFERCDRALYFAKESGRNRTMTEIDLRDEFAVEAIAVGV